MYGVRRSSRSRQEPARLNIGAGVSTEGLFNESNNWPSAKGDSPMSYVIVSTLCQFGEADGSNDTGFELSVFWVPIKHTRT